jgi:hypothetical protein
MTKSTHVATHSSEEHSVNVPSPEFYRVMENLKGNQTFDALTEEDQIAYANLLVEADDWARSYGFRTLTQNRYESYRGGSRNA